MSNPIIVDEWQDEIVYGDAGPEPNRVFEDEDVRVIVAGLKPGQSIPEHPETLATYHFLAGEGSMTVDGSQFPVRKGQTVVVSAGAERGIDARTHLAFLAHRIG